MIAVDTNILVYSHREESPFHSKARLIIANLREASADWSIPWPCIHEFIAIVTNPKIFKVPTPIEAAFASIDSWLAGENAHLLAESDGYFTRLREISSKAKIQGGRIHDARIAALCLHHGISELWTADRDFLAFPKLTIRNPLVVE